MLLWNTQPRVFASAQLLLSLKKLRSSVAIISMGLLAACNVDATPKEKSADKIKDLSANSVAPQSVSSQSASMSAVEKAIKAQLELKWDDLKITSVQALPWVDLYEVVLSNNDIVYTNKNTDFTLIGNLIRNQDKRNLTQERSEKLLTVDFKSLPFSQASTQIKGAGTRHIAVFEDPNCGYCKRFRQILEQTDNITIHTFIVDILGDESTAMAKRLLCAPKPVAAWNAWMLQHTEPPQAQDCDTSVLSKNRALAQKLGVTGTPTIIFANGKRIPGMASKVDLEKALDTP
jgi:thiol:disulfide interchange protein DsbC